MNSITIVMPYYNNGGMVIEHIKEWQKYPAELLPYFNAIIVDDGSQRTPAIDYIHRPPFPVRVFRILKDIPWNQDGARNLGMSVALGWCLLTDIDHLLEADAAKKLLRTIFRENVTYQPIRRKAVSHDPYHKHPNSFVITPETYWKAGGYDERFAGYYGTDGPFYARVKKITPIVEIDIPLTLYGRQVIPDASTVDYGRKGSPYHIDLHPKMHALKASHPTPIKPLNFEWERVL